MVRSSSTIKPEQSTLAQLANHLSLRKKISIILDYNQIGEKYEPTVQGHYRVRSGF